MNEQMKFISRVLEGETMKELCREFQISRETGCKIWNRYEEKGIEVLLDASRKAAFLDGKKTCRSILGSSLLFFALAVFLFQNSRASKCAILMAQPIWVRI